jgi:hypothetical protein
MWKRKNVALKLLHGDLVVHRFSRFDRLSVHDDFGTVCDFSGGVAHGPRLYIATKEHHLLDNLNLDCGSPRGLVFVEPFANGGLQDCVVQRSALRMQIKIDIQTQPRRVLTACRQDQENKNEWNGHPQLHGNLSSKQHQGVNDILKRCLRTSSGKKPKRTGKLRKAVADALDAGQRDNGRVVLKRAILQQ